MDQNRKPAANDADYNSATPPIIDGKEVKKFLFARYTRFIQNGAIPVDTHARNAVLKASDQKRYLVNVQVEAFDKDHAIARLVDELYPFIEKGEWEFVDEIEWGHDLGMMGAKHPMLPMGATLKKNLH